MGPTEGTVSQAAWSICAGSRQGGVLDVLAQQQRVPEILNVVFQRLTGSGIVGVLAQRAKRREGGYAVDDPLFRAADEFVIPGISVFNDRVAIKPSAQGILTASCVS